jgi:hypothetical protein
MTLKSETICLPQNGAAVVFVGATFEQAFVA